MSISFEFSPEHEAFRETMRSFARSQLLPTYVERNKSHDYPWEEHKAIADLGALGIGLPEQYGGTGEHDFIALGIACEELGYGDVGLAGAPIMSGLTCGLIADYGTDEVKGTWLARLIDGESLVSLGLTEPGAGSDVSALRTVATPVPGGYRITGEKTSITFVPHADIAIVFARLPGTVRSTGVCAFVVEFAAEGVSCGGFTDMGLATVGRGWIALQDVFVPTESRLGEEGRGFQMVMHSFDYSRAAIGLQCLGAARASLDETWEYIQQRTTFDHPLAHYQGVTLPLGEHETYYEAARWMCYQTLWLRQENKPHTAQSSMSKWWAPRVAYDAIQSCLLVHGHLGYSDDYPFQMRMRDVFGYWIGDGSAEVQKLIIARQHAGPGVMGR